METIGQFSPEEVVQLRQEPCDCCGGTGWRWGFDPYGKDGGPCFCCGGDGIYETEFTLVSMEDLDDLEAEEGDVDYEQQYSIAQSEPESV